MKTFIKKNIRFIIIVVICITCSVLTTFATDYLFNSSEVYYNNTTSGIQADKVQGAIDELYACASNYAAYNQRLTNTENTIGSGNLTTTSQTLIGAVNEVKAKVIKTIPSSVLSGSLAAGSITTVTMTKPSSIANKTVIAYMPYCATPQSAHTAQAMINYVDGANVQIYAYGSGTQQYKIYYRVFYYDD